MGEGRREGEDRKSVKRKDGRNVEKVRDERLIQGGSEELRDAALEERWRRK